MPDSLHPAPDSSAATPDKHPTNNVGVVSGSAAGEPVPDFHKHTRGFGPVMGHEHDGGQRPHDHDLDGLSWGPPQFFTPEGLDA